MQASSSASPSSSLSLPNTTRKQRKCALCKCDARYCCSACRRVHYCSVACQRKHWPVDHRYVCAAIACAPSARAVDVLAAKRAVDGRPTFNARRAYELYAQHRRYLLLREPVPVALERRCNVLFAREQRLLARVPQHTARYQEPVAALVHDLYVHDALRLHRMFVSGWHEHGPGAVVMHYDSIDAVCAHRPLSESYRTIDAVRSLTETTLRAVDAIAMGAINPRRHVVYVAVVRTGILVNTTTDFAMPFIDIPRTHDIV